MTRVLVVAPSPIMCLGLCDILESQPDITVAAQADSLTKAKECLDSASYDVVILDTARLHRGVLTAVRDLKRLHPGVPLLVFSSLRQDVHGPLALSAGASGYVAKTASPPELVQAVRMVASGGTFLPGNSPPRPENCGCPPPDVLSPRELDVLLGVGQGRALQDIATELQISVKTVGTYRARVAAKLGLSSPAEMIRYAIEHRLAAP